MKTPPPMTELRGKLAGLRFDEGFYVRELFDLTSALATLRAQKPDVDSGQLGTYHQALANLTSKRTDLGVRLATIQGKIRWALAADSPT